MRHTLALPHRLQGRAGELAEGIWRLADPKIALASLVPFVAGVALAFDQRLSIDWTLAVTAYVVIFLVEVGKNAVNDIYDFRSGADTAVREDERSPFSGGKRTLVDHLLTEDDLTVVAWVAFGAAGLLGLDIASRAHPMLFFLGAAAALISVVYVMPPLALAYHGLGELAVFAVYGPGIVMGTILLLGGRITPEAGIVSIALGILIALVLIANEIPDMRGDAEAGKNTLVVRLGRDRVETLMALLFTIAIGLPVLAAGYGLIPFRATAFFAAVPSAVLAVLMLRKNRSRPPVAAQALTLLTYVIAGAAFALATL